MIRLNKVVATTVFMGEHWFEHFQEIANPENLTSFCSFLFTGLFSSCFGAIKGSGYVYTIYTTRCYGATFLSGQILLLHFPHPEQLLKLEGVHFKDGSVWNFS